MNNKNIFSESTIKLKTKVLIFSGVSLFIGLTKALPTKISLIGLDLKGNENILGWFLLIITLYLTIQFVVLAGLDLVKFFKNSIISKKSKKLTGDTIGLTYDEIGQEYDRQSYDDEAEPRGTLSDEADDIHRKIKILEESFDSVHFNTSNAIELLFNGIVPVIIGIFGMRFLYSFLI